MRRLLAWVMVLGLSAGLMRAQDETADPNEAPQEDTEGRKAALVIDNGGHVGVIGGMVFTPDGKRLITAGHDFTLQEYDTASGRRLRVLRPPGGKLAGTGSRVEDVALIRSPARAGSGQVLAVRASGIHELGSGKGAPLRNRLYLLRRDTGRIVPLELEGLPAVRGLDALAGAPDLPRLAAARGKKVLVYTRLNSVWRKEGAAEARKPTHTLRAKGSDRVRALAFSPDGKRLAATTTGESNQVFVWSLAQGTPQLLNERPVDSRALHLAFSPGGQQIVTGHRARPGRALLRVWSGTGNPDKSFSHAQLSRRLKNVEVATVEAVAFRRENEALLVITWLAERLGNQLVLSLNLASGKTRELFFEGEITAPHPGTDVALTPLAVSPNGKLAAVAVAPRGSRIAWLDLTTRSKPEPHFSGGEHGIRGPVAWSKAGMTIAWRTRDTTKMRNRLDLKTLTFATSAVNPEDFLKAISERGRWKVERAGEAGHRFLQIFRNGKPVAKTPVSRIVINHLTLSATGSKPWLAWGNRETCTLVLSDAATGKTLATLRPHGMRVLSLASSPDGRYLLAATSRELLYVYRIPEDRARIREVMNPLLAVYVNGPDWIAWTLQGYYAASPGGERLMGWAVNNGFDRLATFLPATRLRKQLYQPELISLVLEKGSVRDALQALAQAGNKAEAKEVDVDELLPPTVVIESIDRTKLPQVTVKVKARAAVASQPVKSLRLMLHGRPAPEDQYQVSLEKGEKEVSRTWTFTVDEGETKVAVLARSADSLAVSPVEEVSFKAPPTGRLFALCVGVNKYKQPGLDLKAAVNDAEAIAAALKKHCGEPLFASVQADLLLDNRATRQNVLQALANLRQGAAGKPLRPTDLVVLFFAGHGVKEGKEFYLLTHEANPAPGKLASSAISGADLRKALAALPCQVLLLLDACHSGAARGALNRPPATDDATRAMTDEEVGVVVLAAARGNEYAHEKNGRGFFAAAVEDALKRAPGVPCDFGDRHVYVHHLAAYAYDRVRSLSKDEQHPSLAQPDTVLSFALVP